MTVTIETNSLQGAFDPNVVDGGGASILAGVQNFDPESIDRALPALGARTFKVRATTSTNDAVSLANAVMNLTSLGVNFPANGHRLIRTRAWSRRATSGPAGFTENWFSVTGHATTPVMPAVPTGATPAAATGPHDDGRSAIWLPYTASVATPRYGHAQVGVSTTALVSPASPFQIYVAPLGPSAGISLRWYIEVTIAPLVVLNVAP